jgi:DNA-binding beta-propeller fold protein YncE
LNLVYDYLLVVPVIDTNTNTVVDTITVVNTPVVIDYDKSMRKYM